MCLLQAKNTFMRDLSQSTAFSRLEGGEEMSRERGILASFLLKKKQKNADCEAINSSGKTVRLFKAD